MKYSTILSLTLLAIVLLGPVVSVSATDQVQSLRGQTPIEGSSLDPGTASRYEADKPIPRTFRHQPPLIPHAIGEYSITLEKNDCLDCHGEEGSGAPKPFMSHYRDRDGKESATISKRWYFCTQCHIPQDSAKPLVENTFKP